LGGAVIFSRLGAGVFADELAVGLAERFALGRQEVAAAVAAPGVRLVAAGIAAQVDVPYRLCKDKLRINEHLP